MALIAATQCRDQCGNHSLCTGSLGPETQYNCSCQNGYVSIPGNNRNKTGILKDNNCVINPCDNLKGGCEQLCHVSGIQASCGCFPGYLLNHDKLSCHAINECAVDNGGCSDMCEYLSPGKSVCHCHHGAALWEDSKTCILINPQSLTSGK